ncbi:MAG: hypothetical protein ACRYFX_18690 [Janthinobacterium lividum]
MPKPYTRRRPESAAEAKTLRDYLRNTVTGLTNDQWHESYCSWSRGGDGWGPALRWDGGTTIRYCLAWYQFLHRPGSKEWRPSLIVEAACLAAGLPAALPSH